MDAFIAAIASFVAGLIFLPPLSRKFGLNVWVKTGSVVVWFIILTISIPSTDKTHKTAEPVQSQTEITKTPDSLYKEQLAIGYCDSINNNKNSQILRKELTTDAVTIYQTDENGKKHGLSVSFAAGAITCIECYKNNFEHGISICNSGDEKEYFHYINGELNGTHTKLFGNGEKLLEETYVNGKIEGIRRTWYENGQIHSEVPYKNGLINGIYKSWHENGKLSKKMEYVNGKEEGLATTWDNEGNVSIKRFI